MVPGQPAELTFVGTATALLRIGPFTLLTDPNFLHRGERAYLGYGLSSPRLTEPALAPDRLPPLDAVLLSHLHGDHWDRRARRGLDHALPVVTTPHAARRLRSLHRFGGAIGLRTWESHRLDKAGYSLTVTALPAAHSTHPVVARLLPPVMGSLVEVQEPGGQSLRRIYVTGDTMLIDAMTEIAARFPRLDTALVHVGGTTLPGGVVVTMTGDDAIECLRRVRPRAAIPVHYDDYSVFRSGLDDVRRAAAAADLDVELRYVGRGDTVAL